MEGGFWVGDGDGGGTVVRGCIAFAEVISLDGGGVGADLFLEDVSDGKKEVQRYRWIRAQSISSRSSDSRM